MPKLVAGCLVVPQTPPFRRLGDRPLPAWGADQLRGVRGVTHVYALVPDAATGEAVKALKLDLSIVVAREAFPENRPDAFDRWLLAHGSPQLSHPLAGAAAWVVAGGRCPFLPPAKLEACLLKVTSGKCAAAYPARPVEVLLDNRLKPLPAPLPWYRVLGSAPGPAASVPVSLVEALDVTNHDEYVLAHALVEAGAGPAGAKKESLRGRRTPTDSG